MQHSVYVALLSENGTKGIHQILIDEVSLGIVVHLAPRSSSLV